MCVDGFENCFPCGYLLSEEEPGEIGEEVGNLSRFKQPKSKTQGKGNCSSDKFFEQLWRQSLL